MSRPAPRRVRRPGHRHPTAGPRRPPTIPPRRGRPRRRRPSRRSECLLTARAGMDSMLGILARTQSPPPAGWAGRLDLRRLRQWRHPPWPSRNARRSVTSFSNTVLTPRRCVKVGTRRIWRRTSSCVSGGPTAGPAWSGPRWRPTRRRCGSRRGIACRGTSSSSTVRSGPPLLLRPFDGPMNTVEFFIHVEDLRRGQEGWEPRADLSGLADALWARVGPGGMAKKVPATVVLSFAGPRRQAERHRTASSR